MLLISIISVFIIVAYALKIDNPWYGSSMCFPLGILYAQKHDQLDNFINKKYWTKNLALLSLCGMNIVLFFVLGNDSLVGNPMARNVASCMFSLWIISLIQKINIDYKLFRWLGEISYEIFLLHPVWIICLAFMSNKLLFLGAVITLTITSAKIIHVPLSKFNDVIHAILSWQI